MKFMKSQDIRRMWLDFFKAATPALIQSKVGSFFGIKDEPGST